MFPHNQEYQQRIMQRKESQNEHSTVTIHDLTTKSSLEPSYTYLPRGRTADVDEKAVAEAGTADVSMDSHSDSPTPSKANAVTTNSSEEPLPPLRTANNNMNSKINKKLDRIPVNLGPQGITPSGKPRLFQCEVCMRAFARQEHLKRHERSHTKEKPFLCGVCQRKFSRRDLLLRHAQKLHAGNDDAVKRLRRKSLRSKVGQGAINKTSQGEMVENETDHSKKLKSEGPGLYQFSLNESRNPAGPPNKPQQNYQPPIPTYQQLHSQQSNQSMNDPNGHALFSNGHPNGPLSQTNKMFPQRTSNVSTGYQGHQVAPSTSTSFDQRLGFNTSHVANNFTPISSNRRISFSAQSGDNYGSLTQPQRSNYYSDTVEFSTPQLVPVVPVEVDQMDNLSLSAFGNGNRSVEQVWGGHSTTVNDRESNLRRYPQQQQQQNQNQQFQANNASGMASVPFWLNEGNNNYDFINNFHLNEAQRPTVHTDLSNNFENFTLADLKEQHSGRANGEPVKKRKYTRRNTASLKKSNGELTTAEEQAVNDIFGYSFYDDDFFTENQNNLFLRQQQQHQQQQQLGQALSLPRVPTDFHQSESNTNTNTNTNSNSATDLNDLLSMSSSQEFNINDYQLLNDLEVPNNEEKILSVGYSFYESNHAGIVSDVNMTVPPTLNGMPLDYPKSTKFLFTENFLRVVHKVLEDYPFVGLNVPDFPNVQQLNHFVDIFQEKFLCHYPFIHRNYFNEASMYEYTTQLDSCSASSDASSFVCLPLLIATIGSLYSHQRQVSADLYEFSRRCIHVYLDSRKKSDKVEKSTTRNSPLWLVQSLILSVLYGLFVECDDSDMSIVLKQVHALCTLIKVSKFHLIQFNQANIQFNDAYFKNYVVYQSKLRTVYTIFNLSSLLQGMYNIEPFFTYNEIKCDLPDLETYWNSLNIYQLRDQVSANSHTSYQLDLEKIVNDIVLGNDQQYKVSEFGSTVVQYTLLQHLYIYGCDDLLHRRGYDLLNDNHQNLPHILRTLKWEHMLLNLEELNLDSIILKNCVMIASVGFISDAMKESLWSENYTKFNTEFLSLQIDHDTLLNGLEYSLRNIHLLFFSDENSTQFYKCQSLTLQFVFFNFIIVCKFLLDLESSRDLTGRFFTIYLRVVKVFKELEAILVRNFGYHSSSSPYPIHSITFGKPFDLYELFHTPEGSSLEPQEKHRIVNNFKLSLRFLKIGEFFFKTVYTKNLNFKIFRSMESCLNGLRTVLNEMGNMRDSVDFNDVIMLTNNDINENHQ
ncbi:hypothetical protein WICPIJ_000769 [Wickerhamomyces pijperi]|uniref:C2H2-type domain-containing protein n=1 Tax=Wickerhamomyces pijperi TaxID=599730 RepID=A0A9P8QFM0_WICPI|nr:hypothetical protein WICPIJ_000769 [Wickerhamomyces pijperi]